MHSTTIQNAAPGSDSEAGLNLPRTVIDLLPDFIFVKDGAGRFLMSNQAYARALGASTVEETLGKTDFDYLPEAEAARRRAEDEALMASGHPLDREENLVNRQTGETRRLRTSKVALRDAQGKVIGLVGISRDITEQKCPEEGALSRKYEMLQILIDNLPDLLFIKDTESRFVLLNQACAAQLGMASPEEAVGKTDADFVTADLARRYRADELTLMQSGQPVNHEEPVLYKKSGKMGCALTTKLPLKDAAGNVIGLMGIARDITALKEAERKLEVVHKELVEASRQAGMAEVAVGVLHNVGNVLNSVNVSAELIRDRIRNSKLVGLVRLAGLLQEHGGDIGRFLTEDERGRIVVPYLAQVTQELQKEQEALRTEVGNLVSRIEHIKEIVAAQQNYASFGGVVQTVDLRELLEDALKIHGGAYERHGVAVVREFEELPTISTDKHKVLQIVVNLLHNAKYACDALNQPGKQVIIRMKTGGGKRVKIEVADNGIGIPAENLTRVFSHGFTTRKGGHGFGLHSGALAARELGGSLSVHSDGVGKGAVFTLELPMAQANGTPSKN